MDPAGEIRDDPGCGDRDLESDNTVVTQNTRRAGKKATFLVDMLWIARLVGSESGTWKRRSDASSGGKVKRGGNAGMSLSQTGQEPGIWTV